MGTSPRGTDDNSIINVSEPKRPPFWARLSIRAGNALQVGGLVAGSALLLLDAHISAPALLRIVLMLLSWLAIYICCHALAHWTVGRLVGIRFRGYGLRGTDHPENYPPGVRQLMQILPTFTVMTEKVSMRQASPPARAAMFAAGETSTTVCSILAALFAWQAGIPGGFTLFAVTVVFMVFSIIVTAIVPRGDYAKARHALRAGQS